MITLTISVPNNDAIMAAGFDHIQVLKSTNQTAAGPYGTTGSPIALAGGASSYTFVDAVGDYGDWYETEFTANAGNTTSKPSAPQPGYLSDLLNSTRDLLGVTSVNVSDAQLQGFSMLPSALARVRRRLATFDALVAAGGDTGALCISALAHLLASLLCPRMTSAVFDMEQFKDYRYTRNRSLDWSATAATLLDEYEILISQAAGETAFDAAVDASIALAGPTRGGYDVSGGLVPFYPTGGIRTGSLYEPDTGD